MFTNKAVFKKFGLNVYFYCVKIDETRIFINWIFENIEKKSTWECSRVKKKTDWKNLKNK